MSDDVRPATDSEIRLWNLDAAAMRETQRNGVRGAVRLSVDSFASLLARLRAETERAERAETLLSGTLPTCAVRDCERPASYCDEEVERLRRGLEAASSNGCG